MLNMNFLKLQSTLPRLRGYRVSKVTWLQNCKILHISCHIYDLDGVVRSDDDDDDNDGIHDDEDDDDGVPDIEEGLPPCPRRGKPSFKVSCSCSCSGIPWRRLRESGSSLLVSLLALPPLVLHLAGY